MKYRCIVGLIICCLFSILTGCDKFYSLFGPKQVKPPKAAVSLPAVKGTIIAKVNNIPITLEQLNSYVDTLNESIDLTKDLSAEEKKDRKIDTREKKIENLNSVLIYRVIFYQAALDRRLDQKEEIIEKLENNKITVLAAEMINEIIKNVDVSSAEIEEFYKQNQGLFEQRKVSEIVTQTEQDAKQALMEVLPGTIDFASLAKNRSIVKSKENGGDLGYIRKGQRGEQYASFDDVAFSAALQPGAVSGVFKVPQGYCIIKVEDIKKPSKSEAWNDIKEYLLSRKQQSDLNMAYSKYKQDYKIETYEGEIK